MLRTYIQLYAKAEGQSAALKKQYFPLGIQSAKKSHNLNNSENEIVKIFSLLWDTSLTTRICERLFIQNLDFMLFVWEEIGKGPRDVPDYLHAYT